MTERIYLGMPTGSRRVDYAAMLALCAQATKGDRYQVVVAEPVKGGWTHARLWCEALNLGFDKIAVVHSDIETELYWLDTLHEELGSADLIAACVAMHDDPSMSSTGWWDMETGEEGQLTVQQTQALGRTFSSIPGRPATRILMSNGLWLADLTKPWARTCQWICDGGIADDRGKLAPWFRSEDWLESKRIAKAGGVVKATTAVWVGHWGDYRADNKPRAERVGETNASA